MTSQTVTFIEGEGDAWFWRNRDRLGEHDPVSELIDELDLKPKSVLEIGCANGWRLKKLYDHYACEVRGIDVSRKALDASMVPTLQIGWADALPYLTGSFDVVIFGFCLYVTDPTEWLRIAAEADRVLQRGGHLIIHDFENHHVYARRYKHRAGVLAYHMHWPQLWLAHPWYRPIAVRVDGSDESVHVLRKDGQIPVDP